MTWFRPTALSLLALLAACSGGEHGGGGGEAQLAEAPAASDAPARMAYSYSYRYNVPDAAIDTAQARHVAMCDRLGRAQCRVVEMQRSTGEYGGGSLKLDVASSIVRRFAAGLDAPIEALGGSLTSNHVEAEDIGRQIVDMTARMRAKEALVARLEQALRTRPGSTADLVATEKAVADAQGELDAARSELASSQRRIDASPVLINYDRDASFTGEVGDAMGAVGSTLSGSVVALIYFLAAAVPWAIAAGVIFYAARAGLRWWRRRQA